MEYGGDRYFMIIWVGSRLIRFVLICVVLLLYSAVLGFFFFIFFFQFSTETVYYANTNNAIITDHENLIQGVNQTLPHGPDLRC